MAKRDRALTKGRNWLGAMRLVLVVHWVREKLCSLWLQFTARLLPKFVTIQEGLFMGRQEIRFQDGRASISTHKLAAQESSSFDLFEASRTRFWGKNSRIFVMNQPFSPKTHVSSCEFLFHVKVVYIKLLKGMRFDMISRPRQLEQFTQTHTRRTNFAVDPRESFYRVCTNRTAWFRLVWQSQFIKRSLSTSRAECHNIFDLQAWPFFVRAKSSKKSVGNLQICFDSIC